MPTATIKFTVNPGPGIQAFWLAVSQDDVIDVSDVVKVANRTGQVTVEAGVSYMVVWFMAGNPGASMSIVGEEIPPAGRPRIVFEVKGTTIPSTRAEGAGAGVMTV